MEDNVFYLVEHPSWHGSSDRMLTKVGYDELVQFVGQKNVVVYRVQNEPLVITADLHLERKGVKVDETTDTTEVQT